MTPRRFYLLKGHTAAKLGEPGLASAWWGKQQAMPGTALPATFPHRAALAALNYVALEDLDGADIEELQQVGLSRGQAAAVIAAL